MVMAQQTQLAADRNNLIPAGDPRVAHLGLLDLYQVARANTLSVMTNSFSNMFLITTAITVVAALLALTLRSGPAPRLPPGSAAALD
jgi:hypothetical protein